MSNRLAIIAGQGDLPVQIADGAHRSGRDVLVLALDGYADVSDYRALPTEKVSIGEIGKQLDLLKSGGCTEVVFAGVVRRPDFSKLKLDGRGMLALPKILSAAGRGDDALLRAVVTIFEDAGYRVRGADEVVSDLLSVAGAIGAHLPSEADWIDLKHAALVAEAIGRLDVGQGAVSCGGVILAVEAQEGTDRMLERCASLPESLRGGQGSRKGVLVKRPKPIQERRIDLPTIGIGTLERAAEAGLAGIAIEAGGALVLDRPHLQARADQLGMFVYGFTSDELA
jgi:DUF1009 family protein